MATKVKLIADGVITPDQITLTTASTGTNTTAPATTAFVQQEISALVDSSPEALNTLNELAAALGDDANFSTTVTNSIATKAPLASPTLTGTVTVDTDANSKFTIADGGADAITLYGGSGDELYIGANAAYKLRFKTDGNIVMDNGGSFGIGTDSPSALLDVAYGDYQNSGALRIGADIGTNTSRTNSTRKIGIISAPHYTNAEDDISLIMIDSENDNCLMSIGGTAAAMNSPSKIAFVTSSDAAGTSTGSERMRIDSSGNVGIGTTSPDSKLHIDGNFDGPLVTIHNTGGATSAYAGLEVETSTTGSYVQRWLNAGSELMRVTGIGRVGIGTSSPASKFEVSNAGDPEVRLTNTSTSQYLRLDHNSIRTMSGQSLFLLANDKNNRKITIATDSNDDTRNLIGIGTSSPGAALHMQCSGSHDNVNDAHFYLSKNSGNDWSMYLAAGNDDYGFRTDGNGSYAIGVFNQPSSAWRARFNYNGELYLNGGSSAIFNINSDERLKEEISNAPSQWELIKGLPLKRFKWIDRREGEKWSYGFIAQEVELTNPEFVQTVPQDKQDIDDGIDDPEYKTVAEGQIHERALAALQEAITRIEELEEKVRTLENA